MKLKNEKKTKKIMFVTPYFYPKVGGLENYAYNIALGLKEQHNWEVVLITSNHENPKEYKEEKIKGMKIYRLPRLLKLSNTPTNPIWLFQIKKIIKKEQPDVVNGHSPVPFIADVAARVSKSMKIPFVLTYHAGSMKKGKFLQDTLILPYEKIFLRKTKKISRAIICSSQFVKDSFIKEKKAIVITPATNIPKIRSQAGEKIIYVGKIDKSSEWKGINYLIEAMSKLNSRHKFELRLIGEGNNINHYRNLARKLNVNAVFVGRKTGKELEREYARAKLLVLPSTTEAESFGMVLIEAMSYRKPVIGSRIGGITSVIDDGKDGFLVKPKDANALAKAISKIIENPALAKKMGEKGYLKVRREFIWSVQINKSNKLFESMLK